MGNAPSHSSEDEAAAAGGEGWGPHQDWAAVSGTTPGPGVAAPALPPAAALLEPARLREAAAALLPTPPCESLVSRHRGALFRWLEERLGRGEESVTLEQFRELLEARGAGCSSEQFEEAFAQFDAEGDGTVDAENMLEALKNSSGANLQGELSHIIRQLQACSLVPGFIDIFSESKEGLDIHSSMILRFLHRNRLSSAVMPYPMLEHCNNMCTMRSSVLKESLDQLVQKEKESPGDLTRSPEMDKLKSVAKCYAYIETSSNSADIDKMTNGETSSYWQSDGSACSHWIRLKMKPDVVLRHLSIAVAATDQSYMPQQVTVAVGRNASDLQEVRDVHIPSNVTGYVTLLENANVSQLYVQINIKRCLSDGCDTRIHGLRAVGFQRVKKSGVSVSDASAIWYWSLLTSLVTASMETNPAFVQTVLHNTQKALRHMPPLSLSPGSTDFSTFLSPNVLEEVDSFLIRITSCCSTPEVELTLLAFALARGSVAKVMSSLCTISDHLDTQYDASSLILSMASVRQNLLLKYGKPLQLTLQACDVKGKEDKSGPENLLVEPWTRDGFLTETGKTRASTIFSTGTESAFQVTQIRIMVRRGGIGAQCGLVFAYNSSSDKFCAEEHFKRFEKYDKWKLQELRQFVKSRIGCSSDDLGEDDPIGWFELEEEWDEADVKLQQCRVAKYLMVKFLCTRQESAERLGVQGLTISGYLRPARAEAEQSVTCAHCRKDTEESVCGATLLLRTLQFIQQLAHDLVQQKESGLKYKSFLDFAGLDLQIFWNFYSKLKQNPREECVSAQTLLLQLLQSCFSVLQGDVLAASEEEKAPIQSPKGVEAAKELYTHLCDVVDKVDGDSVPMEILKQEVRNTLLNGAAIFFPNRQTRRNHLFTMMKNVTEQEHKQSLQLTFRSLCTYFSDKDPGGLLLLPEKNDLAKMNISEVLAVMDTLVSVAARECELLMLSGAPGEVGSVLFSLFWSVQGSLLSWCYLQLKSTDSGAKDLAVDLIEKYVGQFLASMRAILESLFSQYSGKTIVERLCNSVFSMAARQLLDVETWQQEQPVVLHTWTKESAHNYENNCHEVSVFVSPGATYFEVEFDDRCETEKRYDYLEFTDARGRKTRYDTKVGTDKWPKKVTFKAGPRLQFLFHSDSSHNEWGYKFTVTACGLPDVAVSWGLDLQLLVSRLMGRLASQCMALKSVRQLGSNMVVPQAKMALVLSSPLWKPVFRHQVKNIPDDPCRHFLLDFAQSEPAQNFCGPYSELFKGFIQACRKQAPKTDIVAGSTIDQAVNATFAALVYRTPDLYEKLQKYAKECIEKSLLLLKFLPTGISSKESCEKLETADETSHLQPLNKRQRTSSVVEEHFQASVSPTEAAPPATGDRSPGLDTQPKLPSSSGLPAADVSPATAEEPLSPSTPTRRPPFTRGRLRLLSFRSMEEARLVPTVKEKYPVLKDVMDFIKDQSLSHRSVVKVLSLRKAQAQSILEVLKITQYCAESLGQPHCFHPPFILFLLELLTCQKDFTKSLLPALSCVQTALLHLLDMGWEPSDLAFFVDIQLPDLLMKMSQENISVHDSVISQWSEEDELADAKQNSEWMDECQDGMFEAWYEKIAQEDPEKQRKMHMFIARYCDLLNVDISCDGCDEIAPWHRYRCLQCSDMDLCKTCFLGGVKPEGHGDDHEMVNMEFTCDHCQGLIIGRRMNCNVCDDFDLCYGCYAAKKYSYGHLPTHSITAHPMVTIRISDRQRLIQPYIHNYSWLLFAALALYSAHLASAEDVDGEKLDPQTRSSATTLRSQCMQLVGDCLMKAHQGKDAEDSEVSSQKPIEEKAVTPSPEQVFAECSQKRILGLLAAMLPPLKSGPTVPLIDLEHVLPLMFQVVISNAGHLNETYHLTLGLLGQLIIRLLPAEVDAAVIKVLSAKHNLFAAGDSSIVPDGWKTTHLLFSLGAVCLDSRVGLDWACSMAEILRSLNSAPLWRDVIATFTDHCIKQLPFQLKHTNIFTLLVLVGFPQVLCVGTRCVYMDNANEPHNVIILKHFTEKNRAVIVDVKTRKRKTVKDYQLVQKGGGQECGDSRAQLSQYSRHFAFIASHLLQSSMDSHCPEAVEATWVLSLALKGLYKTLKAHGFEETHATFLQTDLLKLLVKKCSKGTGFSKTWLLRDLEILSIMLYSSKKEINALAEHGDLELDERGDREEEVERPVSSPGDPEQKKLDPLEGLDEPTRICFLMAHDALNAPLHILRAIYELQMKKTDYFFLEVQKRFDGDELTTDERIRSLAQRWQPSKSLRLEEQSAKAVDTDMIILPCLSRPARCDQATAESNPVTQKLISSTESELQQSYAKQRRSKSAALLHKELNCKSKRAVRDYLFRVNEATAVLYARHVLASLLAEWPSHVPVSEDILELSGPAHMTYILDMFMQLEEKHEWEKILQKVLQGCREDMLGSMALAACQFMEEPGMEVQVRESKHPYNNNTNFEDKVHIPGAIYLSIKFDSQCNTEEGCDELAMSSSSDFQQDRHSFSGSQQKWKDFELPGDTLYYRFTSDMSNTEWGYRFTVTAGHLGRFQTGFEILKQMLSEERVVPHLPLAKIWEWLVGVACRQTGHQRLKAIHLLLRIVRCCGHSDLCDLALLKPLWQLFTHMEYGLFEDVTQPGILLPLHRALTELFFVTENRAQELGVLQDYLLALTTDDHLLRCAAQALQNIAAISLAINYPNKATRLWNVEC
ncbi:ZZEF1 isoform 3 [Pan troglodytes]|uniref:ZZEF1 isoform 3 n=1 Tax=Pan troglodytes TaxID=9598 RepID=A0A2J8KQX9_PANTR|nr:ZZEF1 isoform 3 [Pan troglodytes]